MKKVLKDLKAGNALIAAIGCIDFVLYNTETHMIILRIDFVTHEMFLRKHNTAIRQLSIEYANVL